MLDFFVRYMNYDILGKIDNAHLIISDMSSEMALDAAAIKLA